MSLTELDRAFGTLARDVPPVALYVHFPFCLSICPYCDFVVYSGRAARGPDSQGDRIVAALVTEIGLRADHGPLRSVYLGGGTPSLMSPAQIERILGAADAAFGFAADIEISLEANPGPGDRGDLAGFRAAGVTRLSIGAQSFEPDALRVLGRRHSPDDVRATVAAARAAGFESISLDLLYDVPGQSVANWRSTLEAVLRLRPDHLSAYALTLDAALATSDHLPTTRGAEKWRARARREQDEDRAADMYELADELLERAGLGWYEISNWSRPGHESRHNLAYWQSQPWEAVGPGAHRFDGRATRSWNAARLDGYLGELETGRLPPGDSVSADGPAVAAERAILRLRTSAGLPREQGDDPEFATVLGWARANGLAEVIDGALRLTRRGRLLSNEVFGRMLPGAPAA